jgi:plastocyanin
VATGTTVTFTWNSGATQHNVTFDDGPASANQASGTYQRTFGTAGSFPYECTIHGSAMSGTITVEDP